MNVSAIVAFLVVAALCVDGVRADDDSSQTIIYIIIAVVVLLFIAAAIFVWMRSRSKGKEHNGPPQDIVQAPAPLPRPTGAPPQPPSRQPPQSGNNNYRPYASPSDRRDRNANSNPSSGNVNPNGPYQNPQRPVRQPHPGYAQNPNAPPPPPPPPQQPPRRPSPPQGPPGGGKGGDKAPRPNRSNETAARVLAEFQSDPALCRRKIPYAALYFTRVLSKGAFGEVWLAQLENRQVAVKRILNEKKNDEKEIECFAAEIKLMASFYHPKIVEFVGVSWSTLQDLCAVTEYMAKGDLYGFLKRKNGQLNWRDHKIYLAEDVADALGYLHSLTPKVIHRDLKSKNILLDDTFRAKLSDFGISRERSLEETMTAGVGTIYWTAPEVLMGKKYTEKADIYSFGIVMSELDTHEVPYSDLRDEAGKKLQGMKIVQQVIKKKLRPTFGASCPPMVRELAARCLDAEPDVRPDAIELLHLIQRIEQQL